MLLFSDDYLPAKNPRDSLIPSRDIDDQKMATTEEIDFSKTQFFSESLSNTVIYHFQGKKYTVTGSTIQEIKKQDC